MSDGSKKLLLSYHRRFLLRIRIGPRWRQALVDIASHRGTPVHGTSISHVIGGDWRSKVIEQLIADALDLPAGEVWPEYETDPPPRRLEVR